MDPDMAMVYLEFVAARHDAWERRQAGLVLPDGSWSTDPVLKAFKFTNVFRVLDYGSQYLFHMLRDDVSFSEKVFRAFLYRYTNRPEPYESFLRDFGRWPLHSDTQNGNLLDYWRARKALGEPIFGSAYKMFVGQENKGLDRLTWAVTFAGQYATHDLARDLLKLPMAGRHERLKEIPRCADFMAMQINTDLGWTAELAQDEDEFVVAGPGAKVGAAHVWPGAKPTDVFDWAQAALLQMEDCPRLVLPSGRLYTPSLMDVQNTFCEFGKYHRYRYVRGIGNRKYRPAHSGIQTAPVLPEHWDR
jgi:hypothetical protein